MKLQINKDLLTCWAVDFLISPFFISKELRAEKQALEKQLEEVSSFGTINIINSIKPKSSVLSSPTK